MRAVRSLLHPDDLAQVVERAYDIVAPVRVQLLRQGFNDTYLLTDPTGNHRVLRVYAPDKYWVSSDQDLLFELELLGHLQAEGIQVSSPYRRRTGDLIGRLEAPEGTRSVAVFTYAEGTPVNGDLVDGPSMHALGQQIGRMHQAMDTFNTDLPRYHLNQDLLIDMPLAAIEAVADSHPGTAIQPVRAAARQLECHLTELGTHGEGYGPIHADIHLGNIHRDDAGQFTLFDFDHCAFGWRAYDLVSFYPGAHASEHERSNWAALLSGYETIRQLSRAEHAAFPALAGCRALWDIGDWLRAAPWAGLRWRPSELCAHTVERIQRAAAPLDL